MRKQHGNLELIEVFAPDDVSAWSDIPSEHSGPSDPPAAARRSRRGVVVTGVLVAVAFAASTVALSDDTTSESAATTTVAVSATTLRAPLDPSAPTHYLLDDPSLTPYSADVVTPPANGEQVRVYTDGTPAAIVVIELHPHADEAYGVVGATRDVVNGIEFARSHIWCPTSVAPTSTRCELLRSEVAIDDQWSVTVRATGLKTSEFARIVGGVGVVNGALAEDVDVMNDLGIGLTFESDSRDDLIFGRVETAVRYLTADGEIATLRSAVGNPDHWLAGIRYLVTDAQPSFYGRTYGYMMDTGEAFVAWEEDGRLLSLVGPGDAGELATISRQVRPATDAEWSAMVYGLRPDYTLGDFETLATGHAANAELWRAGPQLAERGGVIQFLWWWTVPGRADVTDSTAASAAVGKRPHVDTLVVLGATFVFVTHPSAAGTATVRTATGVEFDAELIQPFAESPVYMAVVRVEEPGAVTVEIDGVPVTP